MSQPMNRRSAIGAIAAGSAMLALPAAAAMAAHPDAELFALSRRALALAAEYAELEVKFTAAMERMEKPPVPKTLICQEEDLDFFAREHLRVGEPLFPATYKQAKLISGTMQIVFNVLSRNGRSVDEYSIRYISRSFEIAQDSEEYELACDAARKAAGVTALNDEITRVDADLMLVFRDIAETPAKTIEGVLAKLAACGATVAEDCPADPDDGIEAFTAARVAQVAAIDYAALLNAQEV
jgi:hypothetical protein